MRRFAPCARAIAVALLCAAFPACTAPAGDARAPDTGAASTVASDGDASSRLPVTTPVKRAKLRVSVLPHLSWAPVYIAAAEGDFEREGLDVELLPNLRSEESLVAVATGDTDVRPGPLSAGVMSAIGRGALIRIVAGMGVLDPTGCTYYAIVPRAGLDTSGTPRVRRIRASNDGATRYVVHRMLSQRGLSLRALETVYLPDAAVAGTLANGAIDLAASSEPTLGPLAKAHGMWLAAEKGAPGFQWAVLLFSERLWKQEPELGRRFMRAYRRGLARYAEGKTARNVEIMTKATGKDAATLRDACWITMPPHARINWASIADFQQWALGEKLLERVVAERETWDSSFVHNTDR